MEQLLRGQAVSALERNMPGQAAQPESTAGWGQAAQPEEAAPAGPEALPDLQAEIWVYCQSGRRSAAAGRALLAMGYQQVRDLGGIGGWTGPLVRE